MKWKSNQPPDQSVNYVGNNPDVSWKKSFVLLYNDEMPIESIFAGIADIISRWIAKYGNTREFVDWKNRIGKPVIYRIKNGQKLLDIFQITNTIPNKELAYTFDEPLILCLGPIWERDIEKNFDTIYKRMDIFN